MKTTDRPGTRTEAMRGDVLEGLSQPQKRLPAKYFYDAAGSRLFEEITRLEEYYLTRTELGIMERHAPEMAACLGRGCLLIELGSGSLVKIRLLLDHLEQPAGFIPVDVSCEQLRVAAAELEREYPRLEVLPVCADFTGELHLPRPAQRPARRAVYFPGSTLGNFAPADADSLLRRIVGLAGPGGALLLGVDLQKDVAVLEAAYNDRRGVTAAFNLNLLARINRELGADFDLDAFRHHAFYNREQGRIEMHLVSRCDQDVNVSGTVFHFEKGESIHTENSYKYDLDALRRRAGRCGLEVEQAWLDDRRLFAMLYLSVPAR